jgi:hypothetical protein
MKKEFFLLALCKIEDPIERISKMTIANTPKAMTKINTGWTRILKDRGLLDEITKNGYTTITSAQLNTWYPAVNARLMAKFDTLESRPQIFKDNTLSLWPISNGEFIIVNSEDPYIKIDAKKIKNLSECYINARDLGFDLHTIDIDTISTESQALAVMQHSGLMNSIHNAQSHRMAQTDGGRNRRQKTPLAVTFKTPHGPLAVKSFGVQMEPDAVHESDHMVSMTEAKLLRTSKGFNAITSLHARQLAFPHSNLVDTLADQNSHKVVESGILYSWKQNKNKPWVFVWLPVQITTGAFTKFEVVWERAAKYVLVEHQAKDYQANARQMTRTDLTQVPMGRPKTRSGFPQFDRFNVIEQIAADLGKLGSIAIIDDMPTKTLRQWRTGGVFDLSKAQQKQVIPSDINDLMEKFAWKTHWGPRQRTYLINALTWLGMIEEYDPVTSLVTPSSLCLMLSNVDHDVRLQRLWNLMMSSPIMKAIAFGEVITDEMKIQEGLENAATYERRIRTAQCWTNDMKARMKRSVGISYAHVQKSENA